MPNPIKKTDIYEGGNPFDEVQKNLQAVVDLMTKLQAMGGVFKKIDPSTVQGMKEYDATHKEIITTTLKYKEAQEKATLSIIEAKKAQLDAKTATKQQSDAYKQTSKELNDARNAWKSLAVQHKENTKEAKDLLKKVNELDAQLKKVDATVGQHQRNVGNYSKALDKLKEGFGKFAMVGVAIGGALAAVSGAWSVFKDSMASTAASADKFNFAMEGAKGAYNGLLQSIAQGGANLWENIKNSASAAYDFADAMDKVKDRADALNVVHSANEKKLAELEVSYKDTTLTLDQRREKLKEYLSILEKENRDIQDNIEKNVTANENYIFTKSGVTSADLKWFIQNRATNVALEEQADSLIKLSKETNAYGSTLAASGAWSKIWSSTSTDLAGKFAKIKLSLEGFLNEAEIKRIEDAYIQLNHAQAAYLDNNIKAITKLNTFEKEAADAQAKIDKENFEKKKSEILQLLTLDKERIQTGAQQENVYNAILEKAYKEGYFTQLEYDKKKEEGRKAFYDAEREIATRTSKDLQDRLKGISEKEKREYDLRLKQQDEFNRLKKEAFEEEAEEEARIEKEKADKLIEIRDNAQKATDDITSAAFTIAENRRNAENRKELDSINSKYEQQIEAAAGNEALLKQIQSQKNDELSAKREDQARRDRNWAITEIAINGAIAAITAMANSEDKSTYGMLAASIPPSATANLAAIVVNENYRANKGQFEKGGHGMIRGEDKRMDRTYIPGVGWTGDGEYFSVFNKSATEKHKDEIGAFTDAVNTNNWDLFKFNFKQNGVILSNNEKLEQIATKSLIEQEKMRMLLERSKTIKGNTEIDMNGNKIHYC